MFTRLTSLTLAIAALTGCFFVDADDGRGNVNPPAVVNSAPAVYDAQAGCYFDDYNRDDIWFFQADVDDFDGVGDVVSVWADVYDDYDGTLVQSFELYPTNDPYVWFSDWLASTTYLDCWYGGYTVEVVAYDSFDAAGAIAIYPDTYR